MTLDPGKMSDRIILLKREITPVYDPFYHEIIWYREIGKCWSQFRPAGGREFRSGNVVIGEERGTFTIHHRRDLTIVDRLVFQGRVWDIKSINRVGFNEGLDINAITIGAAYVKDEEPSHDDS